MVTQSVNNTGSAFWTYDTTDAATAVDANGYITDAKARGLKKGDRVEVTKTDASPISITTHVVSAINANGSADLADGVALGSTNSD